MGGSNPYIKDGITSKPTKPYKLIFLPDNKSVQVDPKLVPYGGTGEPGSILDIALTHGIAIDHACGGVCACSTCHVYVKSGLESCSSPHDAEQDMLDNAPDVRPSSRLACQCVPNGSSDIIVEIPDWNRNLVKEGH